MITKKQKAEPPNRWVSVRLDSPLTESINELAEHEDRTLNAMLRVLLREAVAARREPVIAK